jgi:aromatic-L-amino-acid decarboxylase
MRTPHNGAPQETAAPDRHEETLDPSDWGNLRNLAHRIVDEAVDYTAGVRSRPVWQPMPEPVREAFLAAAPRDPRPVAEVYDDLVRDMLPYPMGNIHPRFWMWFMGSSNLTGALGDFLAAVLGSNLGGGNHAAALIDQQVVSWMKDIVGYPADAGATLVSGGSVANLLGLTVARNEMAGYDVREHGVAGAAGLRFYASDQVHGCHQTNIELLGLGNVALVRVPSAPDFTLDLGAVAAAVARDRAAGLRPAGIIATAGTVSSGAIDDLPAVARFCAEQGLWMHVDGCIGALVRLAPQNRHRVAGLALADSIAMDPHKWLHAPFEVGCALVKDRRKLRAAFALHREYLEPAKRGVASAEWLHDYGIQTSRGFRALKVWMSLQEHGLDKFGRLIDQNIAQAVELARLVEEAPRLALVAPVSLNIVCFRYDPGGLDEDRLREINTEIMLRLQESGAAAVSDTTLGGRHCLRAAIANHRTRFDDISFLADAVTRLGDTIAGGAALRRQDSGPEATSGSRHEAAGA